MYSKRCSLGGLFFMSLVLSSELAFFSFIFLFFLLSWFISCFCCFLVFGLVFLALFICFCSFHEQLQKIKLNRFLSSIFSVVLFRKGHLT